jgi:hypothetical protein
VTKVSLRGLVRDEKGQALILALILLVIGGLIMAPLLAYMSTGIIAGGAYEKKADELYAADAGAEDAVLKIQQQTGGVQYLYCGGGNHSLSYNIADVNGKSVAVTVTYLSNITHTYQVVSTATGDGSGTKIDAYVIGTYEYGDWSGLLTHVLSSTNPIEYPNNNKTLSISYPPGCGPMDNFTQAQWPPPDVLADFYLQNVTGEIGYTNYTSTTLLVQNYPNGIGPLYRGGTLTLNAGTDGLTLKLNGTVYITGVTTITPSHSLTIDLNGHTMFISNNTTSTGGGQYALQVGGKCSVIGPGAIIVVGDIDFKPNIEVADPNKPVFVLSISGTTQLLPQNNGYFYGAIAGRVTVDLQPKQTIVYPAGGFGSSHLGFPTGIEWLVYEIASWEVKPA